MTVTSPTSTIENDLVTETREWTLVACSSWLSGQEFQIKSKKGTNTVKIGRGSHCDIIFPGTHLSREHVEMRIEDNHIYVKDKGSANGTFINDVRISEGVIRPGDKLRLDVYSFKIEGPAHAYPKASEVEDDFDRDATKLRSAITPTMKPKPVSDSVEDPVKQWKTKPTSPGNQISLPTEETASMVPMYIIAGTLLAAVALLGVYLFLN